MSEIANQPETATKNCAQCGKAFEAKRQKAKFCSAKCRKIAWQSFQEEENDPEDNGNDSPKESEPTSQAEGARTINTAPKPEPVITNFTVVSKEEVEKLPPTEVRGKVVSKEDFFALTSLSEMTEPGAAEQTYHRWLASKRVRQIEQRAEDPTGATPDRAEYFVEARYVASERRRVWENWRQREATYKLIKEDNIPAALRDENRRPPPK